MDLPVVCILIFEILKNPSTTFDQAHSQNWLKREFIFQNFHLSIPIGFQIEFQVHTVNKSFAGRESLHKSFRIYFLELLNYSLYNSSARQLSRFGLRGSNYNYLKFYSKSSWLWDCVTKINISHTSTVTTRMATKSVIFAISIYLTIQFFTPKKSIFECRLSEDHAWKMQFCGFIFRLGDQGTTLQILQSWRI